MMHTLFALLLVLFGGFSYRAGGSEWSGHDSSLHGLRVAKLALRASPYAIGALWWGCSWYVALAVWAITAALESLPHGAIQGATSWRQIGLLSLEGAAVALPVAVTVTPIAAAAGLLAGPATWIGNKVPAHFRIGPISFDHGPEIGEFFRGAARMLWVF